MPPISDVDPPSLSVSIHMHLAADDGAAEAASRPHTTTRCSSSRTSPHRARICRVEQLRLLSLLPDSSLRQRKALTFFPSATPAAATFFGTLTTQEPGILRRPEAVSSTPLAMENGERALWIWITRPSKIRLNPTRRKWKRRRNAEGAAIEGVTMEDNENCF